jgi:hypothetical protein
MRRLARLEKDYNRSLRRVAEQKAAYKALDERLDTVVA